MVDFMLDNSGDIMFAEASMDSEFQFDFVVSNNSTLFMDFYIENLKEHQYLKNMTPGLIYNFSISKITNNKEIVYNSDEEDYLYQQLKIRISSVVGTILNNEDIGSDIDKYRHKNIDKNLDYILGSIRTAIEDIMPDAKISIRKTDSGYYDYSDSVEVSISNKKFNFYYYL